MTENPDLRPDKIEKVEINTYRFGVDLSEESSPDTPIGAKLNIPFLAASMLVHGQLLPEHSEKTWIWDGKVRGLADRIHVGCESGEDELLTRKRTARVVITLKTGECLEAYAANSRWSKTQATNDEVQDKFRANVGDLFSASRVNEIISMSGEIEFLEDIREFTKLLCPK